VSPFEISGFKRKYLSFPLDKDQISLVSVECLRGLCVSLYENSTCLSYNIQAIIVKTYRKPGLASSSFLFPCILSKLCNQGPEPEVSPVGLN